MEECMEEYLRSETRAHNCQSCKAPNITKYWLQRDSRIAAADIHAPRGPKGTRGSIRHQAHITEHIGLIHIDKEMVHSIEREREREREKVGALSLPTYIFLGVNISSSIFTNSTL